MRGYDTELQCPHFVMERCEDATWDEQIDDGESGHLATRFKIKPEEVLIILYY